MIDRPLLELLNIDARTPLSITTDGESLVVRDKRFRAALSKVNRRYGSALRKLAE